MAKASLAAKEQLDAALSSAREAAEARRLQAVTDAEQAAQERAEVSMPPPCPCAAALPLDSLHVSHTTTAPTSGSRSTGRG